METPTKRKKRKVRGKKIETRKREEYDYSHRVSP
jgi:hypothetical protein